MSKLKHQKKRIKIHKRAIRAIIILCFTIILVSVWQIFQVQSIEVLDLKHVEEGMILEWVEEGRYASSSLYLFWRHNHGDIELPPGVEDIEFHLRAPWAVQFVIYEKLVVACILHEGNFIFFDQDGMVLLITDELREEVPMIRGLDVGQVYLHQTLPVEDQQVFQTILETTQTLRRHELYPDSIVCEGRNINLYFGDIRVQLGHENLSERIIQIPPILSELYGESGVLHLEHFDSTTRNISFIPTP